jgi:RNA 2',3'-cyclic 3'-phosphodiesterase
VRLFVALEIPADVRENLAALISDLRAVDMHPRWVRPDNLHVTLKFIGEMVLEKLDAIRSALSAVRSNAPAALDFRGLGFFPGEKRPRVFWAGMDAAPNLKQLALDVDLALEKVGVSRDTRPFSPHLTLARFNDERLSDRLRRAIQERSGREFGKLQTAEFHLIESKLKRSGAEYARVATFMFFQPED